MSEAKLIFGAESFSVSHDSKVNPIEIPERKIVFGHLDQEGSDAWCQDMNAGGGQMIVDAYQDKPHVVKIVLKDGTQGQFIHEPAKNPNPSIAYID